MTRTEVFDLFLVASDRGIHKARFAEWARWLEGSEQEFTTHVEALEESGEIVYEYVPFIGYTYRLIEPNRFRR